jgi:hypothetical protein
MVEKEPGLEQFFLLEDEINNDLVFRHWSEEDQMNTHIHRRVVELARGRGFARRLMSSPSNMSIRTLGKGFSDCR